NIFRYKTGMPRGTTGNDDDPVRILELLQILVYPRHLYKSLLREQSAAIGIQNCPGLFIDFLEHKMLVAPFFNFFQIELQLQNIWVSYGVVLYFAQFDFLANTYNGHLLIFQINSIVGKLDKGRC